MKQGSAWICKVEIGTIMTSIHVKSPLDDLPKQFVAAMRTLFDIMDDKKTGYVKFSDIHNRWQEDNIKGLPKGVIESLRKVTPQNGLLSFERFCAGLKICLLRNRSENLHVYAPSNQMPDTNIRPSEVNIVKPTIFLPDKPQFINPRPQSVPADRLMSERTLAKSLTTRQNSVSNFSDSHRPSAAMAHSRTTSMPQLGDKSARQLNSRIDTRDAEKMLRSKSKPNLNNEGISSRPSHSDIMTTLHNWHMNLRANSEAKLKISSVRPPADGKAVAQDFYGGSVSDGDVANSVTQEIRNNTRKGGISSRRREPRRHTLASGIDYNMLKRMKQLEQEKDVLLQGLEAVDKAHDWYLRQIASVQDKMQSIGKSTAPVEYSTEAHQEKLNFQMARIFEVNQHLSALVESSERGFPLHMNLAIQPVQLKRNQDDNTVRRLREQNHLLTEEVGQKSERITQLEREKSALIRELFQARTQHRRDILILKPGTGLGQKLEKMAGGSRSNKELWVLISGVSVLKSQELVGSELEKNSAKLLDGILHFKKRSVDSAKALTLDKTIDVAQVEFIQKLSKFLDLDEVQSYEIFCSYLLYDYKGSQKSLLSMLSNERLMNTLMLQIWNYYRCERLYLLLSMKQVISYWLDDKHPYHTLYEHFFEHLNRDNPLAVIEKVLEQFEVACAMPLPVKDGSLMTESQIIKFAVFNLKEQCELLQTVLLYYKDMECKADKFYEMLTLFQKCGFGRRQNLKHFVDESANTLIKTIKFLEALIILETMELEWLIKCKIDNDNARQYHLFADSETWKKIDQAIALVTPSVEQSPVILAWMVVRYIVIPDVDAAATNRLGKVATKFNVFEYFKKMLCASFFRTDSVVANLSHTVVYGIISALVSLFELETLGNAEVIYSIAELLLRNPNIVRDVWDKGLEFGIGILLRNAMEWFPFKFHSLLGLLKSVAASGEYAEEVVALMQNLNFFTENIDEIEKATRIVPGGDGNWRLASNHMPYKSDTLIINAGITGVIIDERKNIIQWQTDINGWQICLCEIYTLMQQMSLGIGENGHISDEILKKILDVAYLVYGLVSSSYTTAKQLRHIIDMFLALLPRFCTLVNPPMELIAKCIDIFACVAEENALDVWKCLSQAGFLPFMTKICPDIAKLSSGIDMNVGTIGNLIAAQECVTGNYHLTLAFLNLMNKSVDIMSEEDDTNFLASELFLLYEIFPFYHKWRYRNLEDREMIGKGCLNVIHKLMCLTIFTNTKRTLAQKMCIYTLLYGAAGQALLLIVGTGEDNIQAALEQQTSWFASSSMDLIELVRLALSVFNRLLLLKPCLNLESKDSSPIERILCSPPSNRAEPHIVLTVAYYGFHRFDPRLATLAIRLLRRFAKELSFSLLACLGNDAEAIRDTYLCRLEAITEDVRLKIALMEFLTACVVCQPGLLEMFLNIPKPVDQEIIKDQSSCLQSVVEILKERHEALHFCPIELHRAAVEFLHALWVGWRNIAIYVLKKNASFWRWLCDPLFEECKTGKNTQIASYVFKILALEFHYSSLTSSTSDASLGAVIKKLCTGTCFSYWSKTVQDVLSTAEAMETSCMNSSLCPLPEAQKDVMMLLTSWREFLAVATKDKMLTLSSNQKVSLMNDLLHSLLEQTSSFSNPKFISVLTQLLLLLLHNWKSDCIDDWKNSSLLIGKLLSKMCANQDVVTARSILVVVSFAIYFLQLIPKESAEELDESVLSDWIHSVCEIIKSSSINSHHISEHHKHSVYHQLPMACVSLLKELLNLLDSACWLDTLSRLSTISCLNSIMSICIQTKSASNLVMTILVLYLNLAFKSVTAEILCSSDLMQQISLPLTYTNTISEPSIELRSTQNVSPWSEVYEVAVKLVMTLLMTKKYFFLEETLNFVGINLDRMILALMKVHIGLNVKDIDSAYLTLSFIHQLAPYKNSWKLQQSGSLKCLLRSVCSVCQSSIAYLIRPNFIQHLIEHQPKTEGSQVLLEEERQRIRRLSSTEDVEKLSPQLLLIQTKLFQIVALSLSTLRYFTPDICEILLDHSVDTSQWEPVLDCGFGTPNIDQNLPMNFGSMISCVNVCLRTLTKNDQLPSPSRLIAQTDNSLQVDKNLLLFVLENALLTLTSQALLYLMLPQPTSRDKQLIKRELGAELNSFSLSMNRYLRRGGSAAQSPAVGSLVSPISQRGSSIWSLAGASSSGSQSFIRMIISLFYLLFQMSWGQAYGAPQGYQQQPYGNQPPQFAGGFGEGYRGVAMAPPGVSPELWQWFVAVDEDRSGKISVNELQRALINGNWSPFNEETCRLMIGMFDHDRSGNIDIYEFEALWKYIQDWKRCFDSFDRDRSGTIDHQELHQALSTFGYRLTPNFCQLVVRKFDRGAVGSIKFDDFIQACVMLKILTDAFRIRDTTQTGVIHVNYEQFLEMNLRLFVKMSDYCDANDRTISSVSTSPGQNNQIPNQHFQWLDPEKTIGKKVSQQGKELKCPRDYSVCELLVKQTSGPSLEQVDLGFPLAVPCTIIINECDSAIGRCLEKVLLTVKRGEICLIQMKIRTVELHERKQVDKDELIEFVFELELFSFEPQLEIYEVDDSMKIERASKHKEKGVELYRSNLVYSAFYRFSKALKLLLFSLNPPNIESKAQRERLIIACYLNIAQCQIITRRFDFVVRNCSKVLDLDGNNSKAYYRRGVAYMNLQEYEKARFDLDRAGELQPRNSDVKKQIEMLDRKNMELDLKLGKKLQKLFTN
uniref:EF-hand domain-containing protein n=1 Tax=Strigamia maritima TaxID=126957 RepID=T1IY66_STRMM